MRPVYIEKDYWITYVLKNISQSAYKERVVFKGGTSLSKAYNLIHRFSEDVDLAFISQGKNSNQVKSAIKAIETEIAREPLVEKVDPSITSKGSKFRRTAHEYPRSITQNDFGVVRDHLILEINAFTTPAPYAPIKLESYIARALRELGQTNQIIPLGLESFSVLVLDKRRTLCEKVLAVARASYESDSTHSELKKKIRHLYDLSLLVVDKEVSEFIYSEKVNVLFDDALKDDQTAAQATAKGSWKKSPFFTDPSKVMKDLEGTYNTEFSQMLHDGDTKPTVNEIIRTMEIIKASISGE